MAREGLAARLLAARRQRCILVQGPAGSGKTSTLMVLHQGLLPLDFDVSWLTLTPDDNDLGRFVELLLSSLAAIDPAIVREAGALAIHARDEVSVEHLAITLANSIASRPRQLMVTIDDLHSVGTPLIFHVLQTLLDHAPGQLHFALGSRKALPLRFARLRAQGLLVQFDLRDLCFDPVESEAFLRSQLGEVERRDAEVMHKLTGGWIAGLQLFALAHRSREGTQRPLAPLGNAEAFAAYFEREVLTGLGPDDLDLLGAVSICERFGASLVACLLGERVTADRMAAHLSRLYDQNFFIGQLYTRAGEVWYSMHPLLREVLQARMARAGSASLRALHARAWLWFREHGEVVDGIGHAVSAGEIQAAADAVESSLSALKAGGELGVISALIRRLPAEVMEQRFKLRLTLAWHHLYTRNLQELAPIMAQIEADAARGSLGARERFSVVLLRAGMAMQRDDSDTVARLLPVLQSAPEGIDDLARSGRANLIGWMHICRGEYNLARATLEVADGNARQRGHLLKRCLVAQCQAENGSMAHAEQEIREVLDEAGHHGPGYAGIACMATGLLGDVLYEMNDLAGVQAAVNSRIDLIKRLATPDAASLAMLALASTHHAIGETQAADALLGQLEDFATCNGFDRLHGGVLAVRARWLIRRGESDQARQALARLEALAQRYLDADGTLATEVRHSLAMVRIEIHHHCGDVGNVPALMRPLIDEARASGRWRRFAALHVHLAAAQLANADRRGASAALEEALRTGHRFGLARSLLDASANFAQLLDDLIPEGVLAPVLDFYVRRLRDAARESMVMDGQRADRQAAASPLDSLKAREREILAMVAQAMTNKMIARVLGISPETVKYHLRNIHLKLGVHGREAAAARWRELSLKE